MSGPEYVAFDLETTGLSPKSDRIIEIGAVRMDAGLHPVDTLELVVDPGMPIPIAVQRLTGISDSDVQGAPSPVEAAAVLADFAEGGTLIAHGAGFDMAFCAALVPSAFAGRDVVDTLELARILLPAADSHSLPRLSGALEIPHDRPHRALSDAAATAELFSHLVRAGERLPRPILATARRLVAGGPTPLRHFFSVAVAGDGEPAPPVRRGAPVMPAARVAPRPPVLAEPPARGALAAAAASLLGPDGPLGTVDGYELREGQQQMASAVAQTLERGGRLLVEAGTGTGKSLAYLVPLALWAWREGRRAVVSTQTITLVEQLGDRDVPFLQAATGLPVTSAVLKGRGQYVSLRRWERFLATPEHGPGGAALETLRFKLKVLVWLSQTETGDRSELRLAGADEGLWRRIRSETDDCLGAACANWGGAACHMVAARRRAAQADLVVTNHALLLADAERQGQVLAPFAALVVDEAHRLEEAATRQLGVRLRVADVLDLVERVVAEPETPVAAAGARARDAATRLFGDVKGFVTESLGMDHAGNATLGLGGALVETAGYERLARSARHAAGAWRTAASDLLQARGTAVVQEELLPQPEAVDDELELVAAGLDSAAEAVERILCAPRPGYVRWLELRAEQAELHEAPVEVGDAIASRLFDRVEAVVLTSATLEVARSFDFVRSRTGVGGRAEALTLPSPFDFLAQALCILPTDVPPYDDPAYDTALADLVADIAGRLGGRTLVLFTGYGPLKAAWERLSPRLEAQRIAVLGQGIDGTRRQVLASYVANPRTVLLGTTTFWEGIDVPGDALSCVVIAKLPFPVPTDPLVQARGAGLRDPFLQLALPLAVIRLRQGFGRLIRRGDDRGAVVLCDGRIGGRDYGRAFLEALPRTRIAREPRAEVGRLVEDFVVRGVALTAEAVPALPGPRDWSDEPA